LLILLHFELWIFCILPCRFTCFHLHLCCGFLCLVRVFFFFVFRCLCFAFVPCHVLYLQALLLCHCALLFIITPCYFALLLVVTPCCFALLLVVTSCCSPHLAIHCCTCCSLSCLTTCLCALLFAFFFFKYLLPTPPPLLLCYLVFAFIPCCYAFLCQLVFLPHSLVRVEEFGTTSTNFIQQVKAKKNPKILNFFFLAFVFFCLSFCFELNFFSLIYLV
jgi:hypothetical protein